MGKLIHGHSLKGKQTTTYNAWMSMKARCYTKSVSNYSYYGGRGVEVCERWLESFENFLEDLGECPVGYSLERKNTEGNYETSNCKWATKQEQCFNQRTRKDNTSGRKGVCWVEVNRKWLARGKENGVDVRLYYGDSFEDACKAREKWELENGVPHYE